MIHFITKHGGGRNQFRRKGNFNEHSLNSTEMADVDQKTRESASINILCISRKYIPFIIMLVWIFSGTVFFALVDDLGWYLGFYQSVSIGWCLGWLLPAHHHGRDLTFINGGPGVKVYYILHNLIGVLFTGLSVVYIADVLIASKYCWLLESETRRDKHKTRYLRNYGRLTLFYDFLFFYLPQVKLFVLFLVWAGLGLLWEVSVGFSLGSSGMRVISTLSGAGFKSLPPGSPHHHYVLEAVYAMFGVPLTNITLGE